jgi:hypothetical protein
MAVSRRDESHGEEPLHKMRWTLAITCVNLIRSDQALILAHLAHLAHLWVRIHPPRAPKHNGIDSRKMLAIQTERVRSA